MTFHSILIEGMHNGIEKETPEEPALFADLNLDQVINAITSRREEYNLKTFFYTPLREAETIRYRQQVMQDMEDDTLLAQIKAFAEQMIIVRRYLKLVEKLDFEYHKKGWFLEAALVYCDAITELARDLSLTDLHSRGLLTFREYMTIYVSSPGFQSLQAEAQEAKAGLSGLEYDVRIRNLTVKVRKYEGETDYSEEVKKTFEKFKQGVAKGYELDLYKGAGMSNIEAQILDFVARLYPEQFAALDRFCAHHDPFLDETIRVFDREIQFYVAYLEFVAGIESKGLAFCYPEVSPTSHEVFAYDTFDLALANSLLRSDKPVIDNDFHLQEPERVIVVSGPNQGGKTTFARMFGQLHYLASLGCPVPGSKARLFLFDQILTHFEQQEDIHNLRGNLQDDLLRIHDILRRATPNTLLILNEIFASTTLNDAVFLSREIMDRVLELDLLCVWVTFIDELSSWNEKSVSMVSTVVPENPALRTFKIVRKPADGLAYALSLAEKHHLTYRQIKERIDL
jgi:DNA mismatch repair protein MutS